jgi:hypothetical protein
MGFFLALEFYKISNKDIHTSKKFTNKCYFFIANKIKKLKSKKLFFEGFNNRKKFKHANSKKNIYLR